MRVKELAKRVTPRGRHDWVLAIDWTDGEGKRHTEYFEKQAEQEARYAELLASMKMEEK